MLEEKLTIEGRCVYSREVANVHLARTGLEKEANFLIDWHLVALPIIQQQSRSDPLFVFKQWLARMLILRPMPGLILGDSKDETLEPNSYVTDFGAWFSGLLAYAPSAYSKIDEYLKQVMPDLKDIKNPLVGTDSRSLEVQFVSERETVKLPFNDLSDGEKCFMICALVLAATEVHGPVFCFWDEPDNYLAPSEVGHIVLALRKALPSLAVSSSQLRTIPRRSAVSRTRIHSFSSGTTILNPRSCVVSTIFITAAILWAR